MMDAKELCQMAQAAATQTSEFLLENLVTNKLAPTPEESKAFTLALAFTIAQLEMSLKLHLPDQSQDEVRKLLDAFSTGVAGHIQEIRKEVDQAPGSGIITTE